MHKLILGVNLNTSFCLLGEVPDRLCTEKLFGLCFQGRVEGGDPGHSLRSILGFFSPFKCFNFNLCEILLSQKFWFLFASFLIALFVMWNKIQYSEKSRLILVYCPHSINRWLSTFNTLNSHFTEVCNGCYNLSIVPLKIPMGWQLVISIVPIQKRADPTHFSCSGFLLPVIIPPGRLRSLKAFTMSSLKASLKSFRMPSLKSFTMSSLKASLKSSQCHHWKNHQRHNFISPANVSRSTAMRPNSTTGQHLSFPDTPQSNVFVFGCPQTA